MPAPYLSAEDAAVAYSAAADAPDIWVRATRTSAANLVQRVAETPDEETQEYIDAAEAAETFVGSWLWETRGKYGSLSGESGSISYVDLDKVIQLVEQAMPARYMTTNIGFIEQGAP